MNRLFTLFFLLMAGLLAGCATGYDHYAIAQSNVAEAQAKANIARYMALSEIARSGDSAAKVAAVMSLSGFGGSGMGQAPQQVAPPQAPGATALQWASVLVPGLTQVYGLRQNAYVAVTQSNNNTSMAIAQSNNAASTANATTAGFVGMVSTNSTALAGLATAGFTAATSIAAKIQAPAPSITLSGQGVIGAGTYTAMTGSTGVLGTGTYSTDTHPVDNHAVSTSTSTSSTTSTALACPVGQTLTAGSCV